MTARLEDGWIRVPYDGPELAQVEISVSDSVPMEWMPAFMHTIGDERVAQIRPNNLVLTPTSRVWIRISGLPMEVGRLGAVLPSGRQRRG